jgi:ribosome-binding factor A
LAGRIKQIVASTIEMQVKDPRLGMVTITDVRLTGDLHDATLFYTVFGDDAQHADSAAALESAKGVLRSEVGRQTGVRFTPTLTFMLDSLPEDSKHIEELLAVAARADAEVEKVREHAVPAGDANPYREPREPDDEAPVTRGVSDVTQTPTPDLEIRRATDDEWRQIWPIFREVTAAGDTFVYEPDTDEVTARTWWLAPPPNETWVAAAGDTLLGVYIIGPNHGGPGAHIANGSYMVSSAARGRGIGRRLVEHSLERTRKLGYQGVQFNAVAASNGYAIKLYQDLGFETIGTVPQGFRHPSQGLVDLLIMYRAL